MTVEDFAAAVRVLADRLGAEPDYCRKCGRDYQPDGTCPTARNPSRRRPA
jgi:hypothetical protein